MFIENEIDLKFSSTSAMRVTAEGGEEFLWKDVAKISNRFCFVSWLVLYAIQTIVYINLTA